MTYKPGHVLTLPDGRTAELLQSEPYTRRDGAASVLLHWQMRCVECGAPFEAVSGRDPLASGQIKSAKRCPDHRMTREQWVDICRKKGEASRKRRAALKASKDAEREARKASRQAAMAELAARRQAGSAEHPRRKLSDQDVAEIRKLHAEGLSSRDLTLVFPVADSTIRNILRGHRRNPDAPAAPRKPAERTTPRRKLSDQDVAEIRKLHAEGASARDLATVFPAALSTIRNILMGLRRVA